MERDLMKKQPEITEATRREFINAFCECFRDKPIEKVTVKELSEKAGYSRVTFYNYFKDPYDLLDQIEEEFMTSLTKEICANMEHSKLLDNFPGSFMKIISENVVYSCILLNQHYTPRFAGHLPARIIPIIMATFGISSENKKALYAFDFYIPGVISMITSWLRNQRDIPIEELGAIIKGILQDGLLQQLR